LFTLALALGETGEAQDPEGAFVRGALLAYALPGYLFKVGPVGLYGVLTVDALMQG
jgi:hypothetical protein